jgi:hypothetical protein
MPFATFDIIILPNVTGASLTALLTAIAAILAIVVTWWSHMKQERYRKSEELKNQIINDIQQWDKEYKKLKEEKKSIVSLDELKIKSISLKQIILDANLITLLVFIKNNKKDMLLIHFNYVLRNQVINLLNIQLQLSLKANPTKNVNEIMDMKTSTLIREILYN